LKNKADINFVNEHGNTPLHYACFWAYSSIAEDLVNYGAYVSVANKYGEIPLDKCSGVIAKQLHGTSTNYKNKLVVSKFLLIAICFDKNRIGGRKRPRFEANRFQGSKLVRT
jgi:integrin-linked kinase